jgi:ketopantoate hydroxymethyltransferase
MAETVHYLSQRGIPVMAHIGLTPQSINVPRRLQDAGTHPRRLGGNRKRRERGWPRPAAFAVVLEAMAEPLARRAITESIAIPTIGIGASAIADGQILVMEDMLGPVAAGAEIRQGIRQGWARRSSAPSATMPRRCARAASPLQTTPMDVKD